MLPPTIDSELARLVCEILRGDAILQDYLRGVDPAEAEQLLSLTGAGRIPRLFVMVDGIASDPTASLHRTSLTLALASPPEVANTIEFTRIRAFGLIYRIITAAALDGRLNVQIDGDPRVYQYALAAFNQSNLPKFLSAERTTVWTTARLQLTTHRPFGGGDL